MKRSLSQVGPIHDMCHLRTYLSHPSDASRSDKCPTFAHTRHTLLVRPFPISAPPTHISVANIHSQLTLVSLSIRDALSLRPKLVVQLFFASVGRFEPCFNHIHHMWLKFITTETDRPASGCDEEHPKILNI
jgi:hypothetical protein